MNRLAVLVVMAALVLAGGCATGDRSTADPGVAAYYAQPRTADLFTLKGTNMTVTYTGVSEYRVSSLLPVLPAPARQPGLAEKAVDGVVGLGKWGLGWYFGSRIAETAFTQPRTVEPTVVRPEIVAVPATSGQ